MENPLRFGILTVSDRSSRGERPDSSGPALAGVITARGWTVAKQEIVADDLAAIQATLLDWCESDKVDVILTTGGTGFAPRDITPEATLGVIQRSTPGLVEAMRAESLKVTPHAMLSRAAAGIREKTLVINLPGSPKGALENLNTVLPVLLHAVQLIRESSAAEAGHQPNPGK